MGKDLRLCRCPRLACVGYCVCASCMLHVCEFVCGSYVCVLRIIRMCVCISVGVCAHVSV